MQIIPVIDIRRGQAVRAVRGDRANYRPLETALARSSDPVDVARGYQRLFPFRTLYIADLDGIEGRGANLALHRRLVEVWPGSEIWIDDGTNDFARGHVRLAGDPRPSPAAENAGGAAILRPQCRPVLGSESLVDGLPPHVRPPDDWILSLDFHGAAFLGPRELLNDASRWPDRVIVMTLERVGADSGVDLPLFNSIVARAGRRRVFAAGGVRGREDLLALRAAGAAGVLMASALHDGKIKTGDLEEIASESF